MTKKTIIKKIITVIGVITFMTTLTGCISSERREIEGMFADYFALFPTENLMDFLDFPRGNREPGIITLSNSVPSENDGEGFQEGDITSTGMRLRFNEASREVTGEYFISTQGREPGQFETKEFPVYLNENGIHLVNDVEDEELRQRILNFVFVEQILDLSGDYLPSLRPRNYNINRNNNSFFISYYLNENDGNIKRVREALDVQTEYDNYSLRFAGRGFENSPHLIPGRTMRVALGEGEGRRSILSILSFRPIDEQEEK